MNKNVRKGHRVVALSAKNRSGAGAHTSRNQKRLNNPKKSWRNEWN